ncbi:hypothetical protein EV356DRAFT_513754 [Viridothelium virens]|uniref:Transcription factor Rba50 n=1 Tax=Viridothelium virens TaxID=1048519 RepID=A0A6A6HPF5_VIRVR|nr:hypothetical protein EV356DRAFT_513754 [Viridothelium virens]
MAWPTRGERFTVDFDSEDEAHDTVAKPQLQFIADVKERSPGAPKPPSAPLLKNQTTGFPAHKKRVSRFVSRQQAHRTSENSVSTEGALRNANATATNSRQAQSENVSFEENEREEIHAENKQKLAQMSDAEIAEARAEVLSSLNPALVEKLLRKAKIDDDQHDSDFPSLRTKSPRNEKQIPSKAGKTVSFEDNMHQKSSHKLEALSPQLEIKNLESDTVGLGQAQDPLDSPSIHFPHAPKPPDLDPSSASFLSDLHSKYFANLSHDPSKLAWMTEDAGVSESNPQSNGNYSPNATSLAPAEIRFSFNGALVPPRMAHKIPVTQGLHHHGNAPDAAGYTIGELAILAQSTYPSQRCIAYSVLGKILWRLGRGEFGDTMEEELVREDENGEPVENARDEEERLVRGKGELARGLWQVMHDEHVIDILTSAASDEGEKRHLSARAYAQEAVWLWRRGGGRRWKAE